MQNKNYTPYISIIFVSRNDDYPKNQKARIKAFIDYYSHYDKIYENLFEFIICDWNPPKDTKPLKDQYNWDRFSHVTYLTVPADVHAKLSPSNSQTFLEFTGNNVCIRRAAAPFILMLNQDVFLSSSIFKFLSKKTLSKDYFYRADRCDFEFNYEEGFNNWDQFEDYAKNTVTKKHVRSSLGFRAKASLPVDQKTYGKVYTKKTPHEYESNNIIYSDFYSDKRLEQERNCKYFHPFYFYQPIRRFFLHTNASGDFLIAPKKAFYDINGTLETDRFYIHLDSYTCVQLFAAGYKQAILAFPHTVFHSDHSRAEKKGRRGPVPFRQHTKILNQICLGKRSYKMNPDSWGLKGLDLSA